MKPNFNTITGRFLGRTQEQWEAEKQKTGLTDEQLYDILQLQVADKERTRQAINFFQSGKQGAPKL